MKEFLPTIDQWIKSGKPFAVATVLRTWGSAPRPVGSAMLISADQEMAGSVSGGCVEGAVLREAKAVLESGISKPLDFGVTDEDAWSVGLSCGGKIQVFLERFPAFSEAVEEKVVWPKLKDCLQSDTSCVLLTRLQPGPGHHSLLLANGDHFGRPCPEGLRAEALRCYRERKSQTIEWEGGSWFARVFPRRSRMIIIGAAHITVDLVQLARLYDFETTVIDPRGIFTNKTQFTLPPDHIHETYPAEVLEDMELDAYTYTVVLSHDPKIDDNALHLLLRSEVAYIGALGSRRTHEKRVKRLSEAGFSTEEIDRIHAPVGVDIRAKSPKEIALSIMGEIIKVKNAFY